MLAEVLLLMIILVLVFYVVLPALVDILQHLLVAVVYLSVVAVAFGVTAKIFVDCFLEENQADIGDLTDATVLTLETASFWTWNRCC